MGPVYATQSGNSYNKPVDTVDADPNQPGAAPVGTDETDAATNEPIDPTASSNAFVNLVAFFLDLFVMEDPEVMVAMARAKAQPGKVALINRRVELAHLNKSIDTQHAQDNAAVMRG